MKKAQYLLIYSFLLISFVACSGGDSKTSTSVAAKNPDDPAGAKDPDDPAGAKDPDDPAGAKDSDDPAGAKDPDDPAGAKDPDKDDIKFQAQSGTPYTYSVGAAYDKYVLNAPPIGMNINEKTGVITWQPDISQAGTHSVNISMYKNNVETNQVINVSVSKHLSNPSNDSIYVVPNGDITNPTGSITAPYTDVEDALQNANLGDTIYIRGGTYNTSFKIDDIHGDENDQITLSKLKGERVKINFDDNNAIKVGEDASFIVIDGLEIDGNSAKDHWETLAKRWWNPKGDDDLGGGQAFNIDGQYITIKNNIIHDVYQKGVNIFRGRYINVHDNIVYNVGHSSLTGGHGIMRKWERNFGSEDTYNTDYKYRFDISGNLVFAVEQRIYSRVFNKGYSSLVIDEGKAILIDSTTDDFSDINPTSRISNNLVLYNGVDHIRIKENPNMYIYKNSVMADLNRSDNPDGITDKNKLRNLHFYDNLIASKGIAIDLVDSFYENNSEVIDGTRKYNNFYLSEGSISRNLQDGITSVDSLNDLFNDVNNLDFSAGNLVSDAGIDDQKQSKLIDLAKEYGIEIKPSGWQHNHLKNAEYIVNNIPKEIFDRSAYYIGDSSVEKGHKALFLKFIDSDGKWLYTKIEEEGKTWGQLSNRDLVDVFKLDNVDIQLNDSAKGAYVFQLIVPEVWFDKYENVQTITNSDGTKTNITHIDINNNDHKKILEYSSEGKTKSY